MHTQAYQSLSKCQRVSNRETEVSIRDEQYCALRSPVTLTRDKNHPIFNFGIFNFGM